VPIPKPGKPGGQETARASVLALERRSGCTPAEPNPPSKPIRIVTSRIVTCWESSGNVSVRSCLLSGDLPLLPGLLQLAIAFLKDDVFQALQCVGRGDVSDCGMQSDRVVVGGESRDSAPGLSLVGPGEEQVGPERNLTWLEPKLLGQG
jgi:hypothetical protein